MKRHGHKADTDVMKLDDAFRAFLRHMSSSACESSIQVYDSSCRKFFRFANVKELEHLTHDHLANYIHHLLDEEELKGTTAALHVKRIRGFTMFCVDEMYLPDAPFRWRRLPKIVKVPPSRCAFTIEHHEQILAACHAPPIFPKRLGVKPFWGMACPIAYHTGLRISDIAHLRWDEHVDLRRNVITVVARKVKRFNRTLVIPMDAELIEMLQDWRVSRYESEWVVPEMRGYYELDLLKRQFRAILDLAKISNDYSFHSYRHGFVTRLVNADVNLLTICAMTGQTPAQVQEYAHVSEEAKRAALQQGKDMVARLRPAQREEIAA